MSQNTSDTTTEQQGCTRSVKKGGSGMWSKWGPCGRPVKEDGLCGIHLGVKKRSETNARKNYEAAAAHRALIDRSVAAVDALAAQGVVTTFTSEGRVLMSIDQAEALIARIEMEQ